MFRSSRERERERGVLSCTYSVHSYIRAQLVFTLFYGHMTPYIRVYLVVRVAFGLVTGEGMSRCVGIQLALLAVAALSLLHTGHCQGY